MDTQQAIREHGAKVVYQAACAALNGDYSKLREIGIEATGLGEAWRVQTSAYKSMTPGERAGEQMAVNGEMMMQEK